MVIAAPALVGLTQENLRSRVSWTEAVQSSGAAVASYYSYDAHGHVKTLLQGLPNLPAKRTDYVYDLLSGKVNYVFYQYGEADQWLHRYQYDADNRLTRVHTSTDGFLWDQEAESFYYAHGPLARTALGHYQVQGSDYCYTLQGWLKGVNMPYSGDPGGDGTAGSRTGQDAFAYSLGYFQGDYQPIGSGAINSSVRDGLWTRYGEQNPGQSSTRGLFNGNIAWMVTDLPELGRRANDPTKGVQGMLYGYDQLNRLTSGQSLTQYSPSTGFGARAAGSTAAYDSHYRYDANGNLLTQQRRNEQNQLADELNYSYYQQSNQLKAVVADPNSYPDRTISSGALTSAPQQYATLSLQDQAHVAVGSQVLLKANRKVSLKAGFEAREGGQLELRVEESGNYVYDAIGNLIEDKAEGSTIEWNGYGKVGRVRKQDGTTLTFRYDASGNRIEKRVTPPSGAGGLTTHYVRDASGNVMAIYEDGGLSEQPIYGSTRLGLYRGGRLNGQRRLGSKHYELANHLGNVLAVVTDNLYLDANRTQAKVVSANDYFPFGLQMPGRSFQSDDYRFGFNGHEKDDEIKGSGNHIDFGDREYDPRTGRWWSIDEKYTKYPMMSPYNFALDNPIIFRDPDGKDVVVAFTGGPTGGGATLKAENAGTTGQIVLNAQKEALARGIEFDGTVIAPGATSGSAVDNALSFIEQKYTAGEKLIIYGYSYGGDFAVELSAKLKEKGITVDLLITVDASDGPLQNSTVDTQIPDNVKFNRNVYQTEDSGTSGSSRSTGSSSSGTSGSSSSDSGTSNSPGSNGGPNTASDPSKTTVKNHNLTGNGVTHGNIDEKVLKNNSKTISNFMSPAPPPAQQNKPNL
jgi:RHS repeat-associated protein